MITLKDLRKHQGNNRAILYCESCGEEYSATPGDYFMKDEDEPFRCNECDVDYYKLVVKRTVYDDLNVLNVGDRVQVITEFYHKYKNRVGTVIKNSGLDYYRVRIDDLDNDDLTLTFYDYELLKLC